MRTEQHEKQFKGWWIPASVVELFESGAINARELILAATIDALCTHNKACRASNEYFADRLSVDARSVQRMLSRLEELGVLKKIQKSGCRREIKTRWSRPMTKMSPVTKMSPPHDKNVVGAPVTRARNKFNKQAVARNARNAVHGGFFGNSDSKIEEKWTNKLHKIVASKRRIQRRPNVVQWIKEFQKLHSEVGDQKRISRALRWYSKNIGRQFVPAAYSAKAFREKFPNIEDAMARDQKKSPPKVSMSADALEALKTIQTTMHWPKGATGLAEVVASTFTAYEQFHKKLVAASADPNPRLRWWRIHEHLMGFLFTSPRTFTERWFSAYAKKVAKWDTWNGDVSSFAFTEDHPELFRRGREVVATYSGKPEDFDKYMEKLNEN